MKKILSTLLAASLMLVGTQAFAQMYVGAGYINSTQTIQNMDPVNSNGFYAGFTYNIPISGAFGIAPGVYYSMIGNKDSASGKIFGITVSGASTFMEHAINVPVHLNYSFGLNRDTKIFVYAGPTVQYGLASTTKIEGSAAGYSAGDTVNHYKDADYNRLNVYAGGGVGLQAAKFQVILGYDYGVTNLYKDNSPVTHRSNLKIGVGYEF